LNMIDKPAIASLQIQNLLSFGPDSPRIALGPLNVLIGPNGAGKSNLIEVVGLLNSTPEDLAEPFRETGGIDEWIWKGASKGSSAIIEATANVPRAGSKPAFTILSGNSDFLVGSCDNFRHARSGIVSTNFGD
jgi:AAA domain, putative AbiEii toxin, Type IV TA system